MSGTGLAAQNTQEAPDATLTCRITKRNIPGVEQSEASGFLDRTGSALPDACQALRLNLTAQRIYRIGRDATRNDIVIPSDYVSRVHCEIYSVIYDDTQPPLIYVRDCQSLRGTFINNSRLPIGSQFLGKTPAYLLGPDDSVFIQPFWEFEVKLHHATIISDPLSQVQRDEAEVFRDRFLITDRLLGRGLQASVYLAIDLRRNRQVVCKVFDLVALSESGRSQYYLKRVNTEADLLSKLKHPNILGFEYAFRSRGSMYLFTELATGGDLFSMVVFSGALGEKQAKYTVMQILEAVSYLHSQGVAHRDLKPENIFFADGPGPESRVVVGDLGVARGVGGAWGRMKTCVGTEGYIAPEACHGKIYDHTVDIWSIGMITLTMFAPYLDVIESIQTADQSTLQQSLDGILTDARMSEKWSQEAEDFIRQCLTYDYVRRPSVNELARHSWFQQQSDRVVLGEMLDSMWRSWEPSHTISPPVEDIDWYEWPCNAEYIAETPIQVDDSAHTEEHTSRFFDNPTLTRSRGPVTQSIPEEPLGAPPSCYHMDRRPSR